MIDYKMVEELKARDKIMLESADQLSDLRSQFIDGGSAEDSVVIISIDSIIKNLKSVVRSI